MALRARWPPTGLQQLTLPLAAVEFRAERHRPAHVSL